MLCAAGEGSAAALTAVGGCISFLRQCLLDRRLLPLGRVALLPGCRDVAGAVQGVGDMQDVDMGPEYVSLDGSALENLEVRDASGACRTTFTP